MPSCPLLPAGPPSPVMGDTSTVAPMGPRPLVMSDSSLQSGGFSALYHATIRPLRRYLARLLGNHDEAQDIAHDAYLRVHRHTVEQTARDPQALLFTTARRLAFNRLQRRKRSPFAADVDPVAFEALPDLSAPDAARQTMIRQELELLEHAIADLPAGCRSVFILRHIQRLSHREIAEHLGIAISTVEKQHARALRLLRQSMVQSSDQPDFPTANERVSS